MVNCTKWGTKCEPSHLTFLKNLYKTQIEVSRYHFTHISATVLTQLPPHHTNTLSLILDICFSFLLVSLFSEIFHTMLATHPKDSTSLHDLQSRICTMITYLSDGAAKEEEHPC